MKQKHLSPPSLYFKDTTIIFEESRPDSSYSENRRTDYDRDKRRDNRRDNDSRREEVLNMFQNKKRNKF